MIKGKHKRKIITRSVFCLILSLSIFLSSLGISFAYTEGANTTPDDLIEDTPTMIPQGNIYYGPAKTRENLDLLYDETCRVATMFHYVYTQSDVNRFGLITLTSYDELLFMPDTSYGYAQGIYSRSERDVINTTSYSWASGGNMNSYYCNNIPIQIEGYSGYWYLCNNSVLYNLVNNAIDSIVYCNANFYIFGQGTIASENLDVSAFLPRPTYLFNAVLDEDSEYILCTVNFNPREYGGMITVWGYNELTSFIYYYPVEDFIYRIEDDQGNEPAEIDFYLDLNSLKSTFIGKDFHISSLSCLGWLDHHEEYLSVNWDFSKVKTSGEYDPPDNNYYYSTYYNENYHYAEDNGNVVAFGNVDICLYSDQTLDRVFWDKQKTLMTPYKYSYVFVPNTVTTTTVGERYYRMIDELVLEFDIVINNCPVAVFDAMYGQGASSEFASLTNLQDMIVWYTSHFRYYDLIPYEYFDNLPTENYQSYDCTCFYTDSFYFKSLAYLLGDSNERLLEFESRLMGEDGAIKVLLSAMKSIYDDNYNYHTDMLTYMDKLNYLVNLIIQGDYFSKYLSHLESIDNKLSDISNALTGTNEEDFDNQLHAPWLQIYRYFKNLFNRSLIKLPDFLDTTSEILDGGSDQVGIGFTLDNDYKQVLPLNHVSVSPTPIPIPTLFP